MAAHLPIVLSNDQPEMVAGGDVTDWACGTE
jgi:hypothetical protein